MATPEEQAVITVARGKREQCICQEETGADPCDCAWPVTRPQLGRLQAYLVMHAERAVIFSELTGEWLAALHAYLPEAEDQLEGWLNNPFSLPPEADLHHAYDLGVLLDRLGAQTIAELS